MDVQRFHVHDGEGHAKPVMVNDTNCAYVAHLVNVYAWRKSVTEDGFARMPMSLVETLPA